MRISNYGRKITLSEDILEEIIDGLANSCLDEDAVERFTSSKDLDNLVESILSKVEDHFDNTKDEFIR